MKHDLKTNWPLLAGLRFALALIVMLTHLSWEAPKVAPFSWALPLNAFAAVIAFLMVSGFSIRHSITTKPEKFMARRIDRIYPVYLACFALSMVPFVAFAFYPTLELRSDFPEFSTIAGNFFMLQTLVVKTLPTNGPAWSLAVEMLFYLCAPLLVKLSPRWRWLLIVLSAAVWCLFPDPRLSMHIGWLAPASLLWAWLLGWQLHESRECPLTQTATIAIPAALVMVNPQMDGKLTVFTVVACSVLMVHQSRLGLPDKLAKVGLYLGELSYPAYLVHSPVLALLLLFGEVNPWLAFPLMLATSALLYHLVDVPYRKRKATHKATMSKLQAVSPATG